MLDRVRRWFNLGTSQSLLLLVMALLVFLVVMPVVFLIYGSFLVPVPGNILGEFSIGNFLEAYGDPHTYSSFWNSILYGIGHTLVAVSAGTFLAWVAERTNTPGRRYIYILSIAPLVIPGILNTIAWIFLLSPRIGIINRLLMSLLNLDQAPLNIFSLYGMVFESGLHWSPFVFLIMGAAFKSLDPTLEEAAQIAGASYRQTFRRITLPLVAPALFSAALIMFVRAISMLETPLLLGMPAKFYVLTTEIWLKLRPASQNYGLSSAYAILLTVVAAAGVYLYTRFTREAHRFATITGKGYRPRVTDLGAWRYLTAVLTWLYFAVVLVIPALMLFWYSLFRVPPTWTLADFSNISLQSYTFALSLPNVTRALWNSFILAIASAALVMLLAVTISWLVLRTEIRGRWLLDSVASSPLTIPGIVMAMALIWTYSLLPVKIYGTIWILLLAYVSRYIPYGIRYASSALIQVHRELEDAAYISGASWTRTLVRIILPLLRPAMVGGGIYVMLLSVKEFSTSLLLYSAGSEVIAVTFFEMWEEGHLNALSALGILFMAGLVVAVMLMERIGRRFGIQTD